MSGLHIEHDVPLAPLTTLGLGGRAAHFARVHDEASLVDALLWARDEGLPVAIMAGGSNLIVPDDGYPGLVVHMSIGGLELDEDGHMRVGAGTPWEAVVDGAINASFAGVECLTGIPGSTGATPIQNVGAYGQEVASVIESVGVVERTTMVSKEITPSAGSPFSWIAWSMLSPVSLILSTCSAESEIRILAPLWPMMKAA